MNIGVVSSEPYRQYERSAHFMARQAQRGVSDQMVALTLRYGKPFYEGEDRVYFLGRRQMPKDLPPQLIERADGTVVVVGPDNTLITTYRNPHFLRTLKKRR